MVGGADALAVWVRWQNRKYIKKHKLLLFGENCHFLDYAMAIAELVFTT
jgi:hypothetical protein